jgi:hypothetical protein
VGLGQPTPSWLQLPSQPLPALLEVRPPYSIVRERAFTEFPSSVNLPRARFASPESLETPIVEGAPSTEPSRALEAPTESLETPTVEGDGPPSRSPSRRF